MHKQKNSGAIEDKYLQYDKMLDMYILTELALSQIKDFRAEGYSETDIAKVSKRVSKTIYSLVHENPARARLNDEVIKGGDPRIRKEFLNALMEQAEYMSYCGDLSLSPVEDDRRRAIAPGVRSMLSSPFNFLYMGV